MKHALLLPGIFFALACAAQELPKIPVNDLQEDFTILAQALKEAHTGMYWYTPASVFDENAAAIRREIIEKGPQTALEFYNTVAQYVALTKEGHCGVSLPDDAGDFLRENGYFLPFPVKFRGEHAYLVGTTISGTSRLNGCELLAVNGVDIYTIVQRLFATFAADGNNLTSKYRWLDDLGFARLYAKTISWNTPQFDLLVRMPGSESAQLVSIPAVRLTELRTGFTSVAKLFDSGGRPAELTIAEDYALLTIRTFSGSRYRKAGMRFEAFIDSCFNALKHANVQNLIIDLRANGGGTEGYEDYLFAWLALKPYNKYRFVETNALTYSFLDLTDYADPKERRKFERLLAKEFRYDAPSGKYHRKIGIERPEEPKKQPFTGKLYVLAGGVTYSGGAEFCSLVRDNRESVFVGEEVGGGFYGNTSGYSVTLTLPHSKVSIEIPIVRFVLDVSGQPEGTGVLPDYAVTPTIGEFLEGTDAELEFAVGLIRGTKP